MDKDSENKAGEQPLLVFPPYMSRFLWVTLLLMIALGFTSPLVAISFLEVSNEWMVPTIFPPVFIFITLNFMVTKGIPFGIIGLKAISLICLVLSILGIFFNHALTLCLVSGGCSLLSYVTITGDKYQEMFSYMQDMRKIRQLIKEEAKGNR